MYKRIGSAIFAALILLSVISCSKEAASVDSGTGTLDTAAETVEETTRLDDLPEGIDFDGTEVRIYSRSHFRFADEITVDDMNGDAVNDKIFERKQKVEERLNVKINNHKATDDPHGSIWRVRDLVWAGDDAYDIATASMYTAAPESSNAIFIDLLDAPYIDVTKPYYSADYIKSTQIGKSLYTVTGDISLSLLRYSFCVYFNKTLLENYGIDEPYDLVRAGAWTHDKLRSIVMGIYGDINGNGEVDMEDFFGLGTSDVIIVDAYTASYDLRMMDIDSDGNPYFCINLEKFADAVKKLYELNHETTGVFPYVEISDNNEMTDLCNYFSQDHHVFINNWIYGTETAYLRNMQSDYGIIPYPKWDENQKTYLTFQHDQIGVFGIPITSTRVEAAAAVIEAMSSESALGLKPIYYDVALKGKYLRDETSAEMIEIIHNNRAFDPAWVYCLFIGDLAQTPRNLLLSGKSDFMSYYKKREKMYNRNLEKLIEAFSKIGQ